MVFPDINIASAQGRIVSTPDIPTSLIGPSESQGESSSQQDIRRLRRPTSPAGAQMDDARNDNDKKQSNLVPPDSWDGIITDKPTFPLSEIMALKRCNFSAHFYAYARLNGRTGAIARDLILDTLERCTIMPEVDSEPEADGAEWKLEVERRSSRNKRRAKEGKHPRITAAQDADADADTAAANGDHVTDLETPRPQTFEQVCEDLSKCIQGMDVIRHTKPGGKNTSVCPAVSESAGELGKRSPAQRVAASSSSSTPSAIDTKTHCVVPRPCPWDGEPCGRLLPCVAHSTRQDHEETLPSELVVQGQGKANACDIDEVEEKLMELEQLSLEYENASRSKGDDDDVSGAMSYSKAAKKAAQYYATTSAYGRGKPLQEMPDGGDDAPCS